MVREGGLLEDAFLVLVRGSDERSRHLVGGDAGCGGCVGEGRGERRAAGRRHRLNEIR